MNCKGDGRPAGLSCDIPPRVSGSGRSAWVMVVHIGLDSLDAEGLASCWRPEFSVAACGECHYCRLIGWLAVSYRSAASSSASTQFESVCRPPVQHQDYIWERHQAICRNAQMSSFRAGADPRGESPNCESFTSVLCCYPRSNSLLRASSGFLGNACRQSIRLLSHIFYILLLSL